MQSNETFISQTTATVPTTFTTRSLHFEFPLVETIVSGADYLKGKSGVRTLSTGVILVYGEAFCGNGKVTIHINRATFKGVEITPVLKHFGNYSDIEDAALNTAKTLFNQNMEG